MHLSSENSDGERTEDIEEEEENENGQDDGDDLSFSLIRRMFDKMDWTEYSGWLTSFCVTGDTQDR